jgi:hypothetical protein
MSVNILEKRILKTQITFIFEFLNNTKIEPYVNNKTHYQKAVGCCKSLRSLLCASKTIEPLYRQEGKKV